MDMEFFYEHVEEFQYLDELRYSGVTNMYGAVPYLVKEFPISEQEARKILAFWMDNYEEIMEEYDK